MKNVCCVRSCWYFFFYVNSSQKIRKLFELDYFEKNVEFCQFCRAKIRHFELVRSQIKCAKIRFILHVILHVRLHEISLAWNLYIEFWVLTSQSSIQSQWSEKESLCDATNLLNDRNYKLKCWLSHINDAVGAVGRLTHKQFYWQK